MELKALRLTANTMTAEEVAAALGVRPRTVRYYLDRAAEKLCVNSRKAAVAKALADGLVDLHQPSDRWIGEEADLPK
ncbi:MAG: LuxR C-terminal-related transcriptional regulator [Panacagrimonas sp.]